MSFSASLAYVRCCVCGEPIMLSGVTLGAEPEHLTTRCEHCGSLIEITRQRLGKFSPPRSVKPS